MSMLHLFSLCSFLPLLESHNLLNSVIVHNSLLHLFSFCSFFPLLLFFPSSSPSSLYKLSYFKLLLQFQIPPTFALGEWANTKFQKTYCYYCTQRKKDKALGLHPTNQEPLILSYVTTWQHHIGSRTRRNFWAQNLAWICTSMFIDFYTFENFQ